MGYVGSLAPGKAGDSVKIVRGWGSELVRKREFDTVVIQVHPQGFGRWNTISGKLALYSTAGAISLLVICSSAFAEQSITSGDGVFTVSPPSLSFGDQKINYQSAVQTIFFGPTGPVLFPTFTVSITGANPGDFINAPFCNDLDYCQLFVVFNPHVLGSRSASAIISDGTSNVSVPLTGNSVLTGSFEIVSSFSAKVLDIADGSASDGTPIEENSLGDLPQQRWAFVPAEGEYYKIMNVLTRKVLDVTGESTANGARIQEWDDLGAANQQWALMAIDDVHVAIINRLSGKALDVTNGSAENGTPIQQWDYVGDPQQLWVLLPSEPYNIARVFEGSVLDLTDGSSANGTAIQQWAANGYKQQQWQLLPVGGEYYAVLNVLTGKVLDDTDFSTSDGTLIQEWDYLGGQNQHWQFSPLAVQISEDFAELAYKIVNQLSAKVLDVTNSSTSNGTLIQQWDYVGGQNQQWTLGQVPTYNIRNVESQLVLDVPGGSTADGTVIQQWTANGNLQQQWQVIPVENGAYDVIVNVLTGKALEVAGGSTLDGAPIDQSDLMDADNQLWIFTMDTGPNGAYWEIINKGSGKSLDDTGFSISNGTLMQQWDYLGNTNQQWQLVPVVE